MREGNRTPKILPTVLALPVALLATVLHPPGASGGPGPVGGAQPEVAASVRNDTSPPLRNLAEREAPPAQSHGRHGSLRRGPPPGPARPEGQDPLAASTPPPDGVAPGPLVSFEGVNSDDNDALLGARFAPPDPNGDVGPDHYVQWNNLVFRIWDKSGTPLIPAMPGNALFTGFGGPCENTNDGDPIVLFDPMANRWFLSQFAVPSPFYQCIAVSATADPTGPYHRYEFLYSNTELNDYPKFGVWPDGYYMSVNEFDGSSFSFDGVGVVAFDRAKMLQGLPASKISFDLSSTYPLAFSLLPSDLDGPILPPQGSPNYFAELADPLFGYPAPAINVYEFHADFANPGNSTFTGPDVNPIASFNSNMCNFVRDCIPQPGTTVGLDAISGQIMHRLAYRNFAGHEAMVTNATVDVGSDDAGIRWFELRKSTGGWGLHQEGTHAPDADHRWMGSIAMDDSGNIALGYSVSSASTNPSIRYAGRMEGDPLGTLPLGETTLVAGGGSQIGPHPGDNRWGDYSMMTVDPADGCTFWYTNEYYSADSAIGWQTRIGSFAFPGCAQTVSPCTIIGTPSDDLLIGTAGDDRICGLAGDDEIRGLGGNDFLSGSRGSDLIRGGGGNDLVKGQGGHDLLIGNAGDDELLGGGGDDIERGGTGNDNLSGNAGRDRLVGNDGNDSLAGNSGTDTCRDPDPGTVFVSCEL